MNISSIAVTKFCGRLVYGGYVTGTFPGFLVPDTEVGHDVGNGSSVMSSNISCLNDVEVDVNYIYIVFDCILEDGFEIFIITEGLNINFLVYCVNRTLIQEVGDS